MVARSVIDVILGEAVRGTRAERFEDMLGIASVVFNRSTATGLTPEEVVSSRREFNAFGKALPAGANSYRSLAEQAWANVLANGPVTSAMFYATPKAASNLPKGLTQVGQTTGHVYFTDPKGRSIGVSNGRYAPVDLSKLVPTQTALSGALASSTALASNNIPVPTPRPEPLNAVEAVANLANRGLGAVVGLPSSIADLTKNISYSISANANKQPYAGMVVHHSEPSTAARLADITNNPREDGSLRGYHFAIDAQGNIAQLAPLDQRVNHIGKVPSSLPNLSNRNSVAVTLLGAENANTPEQLKALQSLTEYLGQQGIELNPLNIGFHGKGSTPANPVEGKAAADYLSGSLAPIPTEAPRGPSTFPAPVVPVERAPLADATLAYTPPSVDMTGVTSDDLAAATTQPVPASAPATQSQSADEALAAAPVSPVERSTLAALAGAQTDGVAPASGIALVPNSPTIYSPSGVGGEVTQSFVPGDPRSGNIIAMPGISADKTLASAGGQSVPTPSWAFDFAAIQKAEEAAKAAQQQPKPEAISYGGIPEIAQPANFSGATMDAMVRDPLLGAAVTNNDPLMDQTRFAPTRTPEQIAASQASLGISPLQTASVSASPAPLASASLSDVMSAKSSESVTDAEYRAALSAAGLSSSEIDAALSSRNGITDPNAALLAPPLPAPITISAPKVASVQPSSASQVSRPSAPKIPTGTDFWQGKSNTGVASDGSTLYRDANGTEYRYSPMADKVFAVGENGQAIPAFGFTDPNDTLLGKVGFGGTGLSGKTGKSIAASLAGAGLGAFLGGALGGPVGSKVGGAIGGKIGGSLASGTNPVGRSGGVLGQLFNNMFGVQTYPYAPDKPAGGGDSGWTSEQLDRLNDLSPAVADATRGGAVGLW